MGTRQSGRTVTESSPPFNVRRSARRRARRRHGRVEFRDPALELRAHLQARPGSWDTAEALGLLLLWSGDEEGALKLLDSRAGLHANVERVGEYRKTVFTALKLTVRTRADKVGPAAASAWVSGLLASTQDEPARAQLQSWITKLDAAVAPPSPSSR